jgi:hypothetical protein
MGPLPEGRQRFARFARPQAASSSLAVAVPGESTFAFRGRVVFSRP